MGCLQLLHNLRASRCAIMRLTEVAIA